MSAPAHEFSRPVDIRGLGDAPLALDASAEERAALARRFGIVSVNSLTATVTLVPDGAAIAASGRLVAHVVQSCAVSGEDLPVAIDEPLSFRFVPASTGHRPDEEVEISEDECDEIAFEGTRFDVGEAIAQSLALAIDPYATGPDAERVRREAGLLGEEAAGPFAALAALKKPD